MNFEKYQKGNLVDKCSPGDDISICGTLIKRWKKVVNNSRPDVNWCIYANSITVDNKEKSKDYISFFFKVTLQEILIQYLNHLYQ